MMQEIQSVLNTLNTITVSGKANLDKLLGCIMVLESVKKEVAERESAIAAKEV